MVGSSSSFIDILESGHTTYYLGPYFGAIVILLLSFLLARIIKMTIQIHFVKISKKEKSDVILEVISKPIYYSIFFLGLYLAANSIKETISNFEVVKTVFFVSGVLLGAWISTRILTLIVTLVLEHEKKIEKVPAVLNKIISVFVFMVALLMIFDYFDIALSPLIATLGVGSIAIGLALQSTLSDFVAGMHVLSDKPIRVGDFIELEDGTMGYVDDIGWRSTRIRTLLDYSVILPNNKLAQSKITNYCIPVRATNLVINCGVSYESDLDKVEKVTLEVAREIQKRFKECVSDWKPIVRFKEFGDSNINFFVILRLRDYANKFIIQHYFIKALKRRFDEEGIEISWPIRKVYFANEKSVGNRNGNNRNQKK